jgi:hypothetical protein
MKSSGLLAIAKREAKILGKDGPVCIDDVTDALVRLGYNKAANNSNSSNFWKGKVFSGGDWVKIDDIPSRKTTSHARPVSLWALKSWISGGVNGEEFPKVSAYHLIKIKNDFIRDNRGIDLSTCKWYVGLVKLSPVVKSVIVRDGNTLYNAPVVFMPSACGAILAPPTI